MSACWPEADELAALYAGLVVGAPLAPSDLAGAVLDPLVAHLRYRFPGADEHDYHSAAADAVVSLIRSPAVYNPARRGLRGFLQMAAEQDFRNLRDVQRKHHTNRESSEYVELAADVRNNPADGDSPFDDPPLAVEIGSFAADERAVFELMRDGERDTSVFAAALGIGHLSPDEQTSIVKRVKDRIKARLKRAVEGQT
jgi:hypothetical protein